MSGMVRVRQTRSLASKAMQCTAGPDGAVAVHVQQQQGALELHGGERGAKGRAQGGQLGRVQRAAAVGVVLLEERRQLFAGVLLACARRREEKRGGRRTGERETWDNRWSRPNGLLLHCIKRARDAVDCDGVSCGP